ncbi:MAG: flagellar hook-length control protein FliK [Oleispira antarctica]|nr:flagellar hook-length control protein FliK [Oleispira antarctica]MBQ0791723.1 flagellar hook-length control protein FliK [Oleispira antarctica]
MDRIPLINPQLVKVVATKAERTPAPVLKAEVVSSEPIKSSRAQEESVEKKTSSEEQRYKVILKIGQQQLETISTESFKKGSQFDVKVAPGPELKIITSPNDKSQSTNPNQPPAQVAAKAAMQQLLADRIPNIQSSGLAKLVDQLSLLMSGSKSATNPIAAQVDSLLAKTKSTHTASSTSDNNQTTKQALANLAYQSLNQYSIKSSAPNNTPTSDPKLLHSSTPLSTPTEQVKNWFQQLPSSGDVSNSAGLKNALNNTGVRAEAQLSQLAQQFSALSKSSQHSGGAKNANSIFQQLQDIQQKIFSKSPEPLSKLDLGSLVKNTAQSLENNYQKIISGLNASGSGLSERSAADQSAAPFSHKTNSSASLLTTSNWQNPLLNSQTYATLNELLKDPLLQNPSSNNKFALSQMLNHLTDQADSQIRIPLNWPERNGSEAMFLRTLQNLLGHIEREQGIQLLQSDNNASNNPNLTTPQNQQWLPLLIHHQQQLQLIEFFIDKEEKNNAQGEKKNHWFINLHFDLPKLGTLGIEISMFENECNTTFWSESSSALSQISHHVQPLRERLTEQGIIVSDVQSRHGTLSKRKHNFEQRLVDIET